MASAPTKSASAQEAPSWPLARPEYTSLAAAVQGEAARWNVPGMTVAVLHDGKIEEVATGIASIATRQPVRTDSIFQIGSISKVFAATLAMTLVDESKLDLDEPVITYVPELPFAGLPVRQTITMRHLLSHSSGLEGDLFANHGRGDDAADRAITTLEHATQWFNPGELYAYCNAGFYIVGLVTARLTGKTWEAALQERVLDPLKMEHTVLFADDAITRPHAIGHRLNSREDGFTIARPYWNLRHATPAGGVMSTASDLLRFAQMHMNDGELDGARVLKPETAQLMRVPYIQAGIGESFYGQGWALDTHDGLMEIGHGGATDGFRANLTAIPEKGFAIAQLTNGDPGRAAMQSIEEWALGHYLDHRRAEPEDITLKASELNAVSGLFSRHDSTTSIVRDEDRLIATIASIDPDGGEAGQTQTLTLVPIAPKKARAFRIPDGPYMGVIVEFIDSPTTDDPDRLLVRLGGRLSARTGSAPRPKRARTTAKKAAKA